MKNLLKNFKIKIENRKYAFKNSFKADSNFIHKDGIESAVKQIMEMRDKNQDFFEKHLTYITAGALGILMTLLSNIITFKSKDYFLYAMGFLGVCLVINLASYIIAVFFADQNLDSIHSNSLGWYKYETKRRFLMVINFICLGLFAVGMFTLFLFAYKNIV